MEKHEILASNIDWPNLVRYVARDRVVVELAEGQSTRCPTRSNRASKDLYGSGSSSSLATAAWR